MKQNTDVEELEDLAKELNDLAEGDILFHKDDGAVREVHGFIKDFSGDRAKAELRPRRDLTHKIDDAPGDVAGHNRLEGDDLSDWLVLDTDE